MGFTLIRRVAFFGNGFGGEVGAAVAGSTGAAAGVGAAAGRAGATAGGAGVGATGEGVGATGGSTGAPAVKSATARRTFSWCLVFCICTPTAIEPMTIALAVPMIAIRRTTRDAGGANRVGDDITVVRDDGEV